MQAQNTTVMLTFMRPVTITLARVLTEDTDPQTVNAALAAFSEVAENAPGALFSNPPALAMIGTAMQEGGAVVVRYDHENEVTARVLFPYSITFTKDAHICVKAFCTMRGEVRSFRCDRMSCVHPFVLPGETNTVA
ncbi:MAG: WYL domain-containing protein [Gemmatimonadaceae bacterium]